jgi:hypothetical protein
MPWRQAVLGCCILLTIGARSAWADPPLRLPFQDAFAGPSLDAGWQVDADAGNRIVLVDGALEIHARENTYAHIQRPLGEDFIRVACEIFPDHGNSWTTALTLYGDPLNYTQIGLTPRGNEQQIIVIDLVEGVPGFQLLGTFAPEKSVGVAIE